MHEADAQEIARELISAMEDPSVEGQQLLRAEWIVGQALLYLELPTARLTKSGTKPVGQFLVEEGLLLTETELAQPIPELDAPQVRISITRSPFVERSWGIDLELTYAAVRGGFGFETKWRFAPPMGQSTTIGGTIAFQPNGLDHRLDKPEEFARGIASRVGWTLERPSFLAD